MMHRLWLAITATALLLPLPGLGQGLDTVLQGCSQCHGSNGVSEQAQVAHLNGQLPEIFTDTMAAYANGSRPTAVAAHKQLPQERYLEVAKFYAAQKSSPRPRPVTDATRVEKGAQIYESRCVNCHVDSGRDSDGEAPLLAAQNLDFLISQTLAFKSGVRKLPFMMDRAYKDLTDDELVSLAHFFASQDMLASSASKKKRKRANP
jgi:cytochrome subunit of sulfide dehydrogenase